MWMITICHRYRFIPTPMSSPVVTSINTYFGSKIHIDNWDIFTRTLDVYLLILEIVVNTFHVFFLAANY